MPYPFPVIAILLCGLMIGLIPTVVDGLRTSVEQRLGLTARQAQQLPMAFYLCWLPGMPLAGWLADHAIDSQQLLFYALLAAALGSAGLALAQSKGSCFANVILLGLAYSVLTTTAVLAMPRLLDCPDSPVAALNLGFVPVGLGALVGPWLLGWGEHRAGLRHTLLALGVTMLVPAALVALAAREAFPAMPSAADEPGLLQHPQLGLIALALLLYFVIENCLEVWPTPYLRELGHGERGTQLGLAAFWGAFVLARLAIGLVGPLRLEAWLLLCLAIAAALALGNLAAVTGIRGGSLGFCVVGACYGPLLPGCLALVTEFCPEFPATALGALLALSGLDTLLFRPFLVRYAQQRPAREIMRAATLLALGLGAPLLALALLQS